MSSQFISVTMLNGYIKNIVDSEEMLHNIGLAGEVSGIKCSGAHAYFTLKDTNAQIECCCFGYARTYLPKSGESVLLNGSLDFYAKGGRVSFVAKTIAPLGQGALAIKLEELKKRLLAQGFFDQTHKIDIPNYPKNVCVITAKTGAVIRDIVTTIRKNNNIINIDVVDVKVQGQYAVESIIQAIKDVDTLNYDTIIIARGGGSFEDLMPFNDERLVYAIYEAKTPIISAVGHETDFTLCDMVADLRVPTPTAAGERVGYNVLRLNGSFVELKLKIASSLEKKMDMQFLRLISHVKSLTNAYNLTEMVYKNNMASCCKLIVNVMNNQLQDKEYKLRTLVSQIDNNNPTKILKQGYCKIYDNSGLVKDIASVEVGENITIFGDGGRMKADVTQVIKEN